MEQFYAQFGFKRGGTAGNKDFIGRICREIISPPMLAELQAVLVEDGVEVGVELVRYLAAIHDLHMCCVAESLENLDYHKAVQDYIDAFDEVHEVCGVPETVKVHILRSVNDKHCYSFPTSYF